MEKIPKRDDTAANVKRKSLSGPPPPPVKLIEESDLLQQSLCQRNGEGGGGQTQPEQVVIKSPVKSKAYPGYTKSTIQTGDPDETESNYSSAYSSKSDSVTPVDSFSELSDGSLDERGRQASQTSSVSSNVRYTQPDSDFVPKKTRAWNHALGRWTFNGVAPYPLSPQLKDGAKRSQEVRIPVSPPASDTSENLLTSESNSSLTSWAEEKEVPHPSLVSKNCYPLGRFVRNPPLGPTTHVGSTAKLENTPPAKVPGTADKPVSPPCTELDKKQPKAVTSPTTVTSPAAGTNQNTPSPDTQSPRSVVSRESFFTKSPAWDDARKKSELLAKARQGGGAEQKQPAANGSSEEPTDLEQRAKAFGGVRRPASLRRTQSMFVRPAGNNTGGMQPSKETTAQNRSK